MVSRFDVCLVQLDPTVGSEVKKTRLAVVVSPNEMNRHLNTVIIAPLTSTIRGYPTRVKLTFNTKKGEVMLDQLRTIDKRRLVKKLGVVSKPASESICQGLFEMFVW